MSIEQTVSVEETRTIWDTKARFWDERMGDGNAFHLTAVGPAAEELLAIEPGERVLDVGCGNGVLDRRLAELGATVLATDFSPVFLDAARERTASLPCADRITWSLLDATDPDALGALAAESFDAVVTTMALQDMPHIEPLAAATPALLRPGGRFVAVIPHPCFNTVDAVRVTETREATGVMRTEVGVRVSRYLTALTSLGVGMPGEPRPHHYFERTISAYLAPWLATGLVLDGLQERPLRGPSPAGSLAPESDLPVILAFRFRRSVI